MAREKLYYSISEVAEMFDINQSNLRYWEKEFKQLKPRRNDKGTRFYTKDDIKLVKNIIFLINDQKLTLAGVRRKLSEKKDVVAKQQEIAERLTKVRAELKGMISQMGKEEPVVEELIEWTREEEKLVEKPAEKSNQAPQQIQGDLFS